MTARNIKINNMEDVKDLVSAAEKCAFDVDVCYNRLVIDARSLIGVMSMDLRNTLTIKYSDEDSNILEPVLNKLAA